MTTQKLSVLELELELKKLFKQKQKLQPKFSVRAFAKSLGVGDSALQKVIRGERRLGFLLGQSIASKMNVELVKSKPQKRSRIKGWQLALNPDSSGQVSWLNLAILEMLKLDDFKPNEHWIAKRLGLPKDQVVVALGEMVSEKMLERGPNGWVDLMSDSSTGAAGYRSTDAIRRMQKELLVLSGKKIDAVPFEKREHGFSIMPVSKSQLPLLKKKIQQFRWELCELAQNAKAPKDEVYSLEVGFFALTER